MKMDAEKSYIRMRKRKAFFHSLAYRVCEVFPVRKNKVTVVTYEGKGGFGCNPKYIIEELHRKHPEMEIVWLVNDISKEFPGYIKKRKHTLWNRAYHLSTSKIWIDNYRKPLGTVKRKSQFYINTWHGCIGFKAIGLWRGEEFSNIARLVSEADSQLIDCLVVFSKWNTEMFKKGMLYTGRYEITGQARCDVQVNARDYQRNTIRELYGIPDSASILIYAPTYQESNQKTNREVHLSDNGLNLELVRETFKEKTQSEWYVLKRLHPQLAEKDEFNRDGDNSYIIDVSKYPDMNELLAACDAVVTDYSSVAFDAGCAGIPIFLYMPDIAEYKEARGGLCFNLKKGEPITFNEKMAPGFSGIVPFALATNIDELQREIMSFDISDYLKAIENLNYSLGIRMDGHASESTVSIIEDAMRI